MSPGSAYGDKERTHSSWAVLHLPWDDDRGLIQMGKETADLPLLVYDGDCSFCRLWIDRWKIVTRDRVEYAPFQEVSSRFPQIPRENFVKSVQLILPGGEVLEGAHAVFRTLAYAPGQGSKLWAYENVPGVAPVSEAVYRLVAGHRDFFYKVIRVFWGKQFERPSYVLTRWLFLRLLGLIYLIAFVSLSTQLTGLVGSHGILPAAQFLKVVKENIGLERYWLFPTLAWLNASDAFLQTLALGGALLSLLLIAGLASVPVLTLLWIFYLSLVTVGQDFLMFQWDGLLLETGFLAIFFAPLEILPNFSRSREPSRAVLWLLRLLLFRLVFSSGAAKLLSGDPAWRNLTALNFHYETQPLPTPFGWITHQLPLGFQKASVAMMFFVELVIPFLVFAPRRLRFFAAGSMIFLQLLFALTGNYAFFNMLAIALCLLLFDDAAFGQLLPRRFRDRIRESRERPKVGRVKRVVIAALAVVLIFAGLVETPGVPLEQSLPKPAEGTLNGLRALHIVSRYGLFAVMTTSRPEIIIEGSRDGQNWLAYDFKYKTGDVMRPPAWVAPHQPRLDWQMWFAALGSYRQNPWFVNLLLRLLQGSPEVLALLAKNPFPNAPPRYLRALVYEYHFTNVATMRAAGAWWRRELKGQYFPVVSLR